MARIFSEGRELRVFILCVVPLDIGATINNTAIPTDNTAIPTEDTARDLGGFSKPEGGHCVVREIAT